MAMFKKITSLKRFVLPFYAIFVISQQNFFNYFICTDSESSTPKESFALFLSSSPNYQNNCQFIMTLLQGYFNVVFILFSLNFIFVKQLFYILLYDLQRFTKLIFSKKNPAKLNRQDFSKNVIVYIILMLLFYNNNKVFRSTPKRFII